MNQQEFKKSSLEGIDKMGQGALQMISSLEKIIKSSYSRMGEAEARKFAEILVTTKMDERVKEFAKQIKELKKDLK